MLPFFRDTRMERLVWQVIKNQEVIMAQLDDLKAALEGMDVALDGVREAVARVAADVQTLIDMLSEQPQPTDLTEVLAKAEALQAEVQQVSDALGAIPPAPQAP